MKVNEVYEGLIANEANILNAWLLADELMLKGKQAVGLKTVRDSICISMCVMDTVSSTYVNGVKYDGLLSVMEHFGCKMVFIKGLNRCLALFDLIAIDYEDLNSDIVHALLDRPLTYDEEQELLEFENMKMDTTGKPYLFDEGNSIVSICGKPYHFENMVNLYNEKECGMNWFFPAPDGKVFIESATDKKCYEVTAQNERVLNELSESMGFKKYFDFMLKKNLGLWNVGGQFLYDDQKNRLYLAMPGNNMHVDEEKKTVEFTRDAYNGIVYEELLYEVDLVTGEIVGLEGRRGYDELYFTETEPLIEIMKKYI